MVRAYRREKVPGVSQAGMPQVVYVKKGEVTIRHEAWPSVVNAEFVYEYGVLVEIVLDPGQIKARFRKVIE